MSKSAIIGLNKGLYDNLLTYPNCKYILTLERG